MTIQANRTSGRELADLWSGAVIFAPHLAGCSCAGFYVPLDPASVELDLLEYLAHKYKTAGHAELAAFVSARAQGQTPAFGKWLEMIDTSPLAPPDRDRLTGDLFATLESMNSARPARSGFVCY